MVGQPISGAGEGLPGDGRAQRLRVWYIDDDPLTAGALTMMAERCPDLCTSAMAPDVPVEQLELDAGTPSVVVVDLFLHRYQMDGIDLVTRIASAEPRAAIAICNPLTKREIEVLQRKVEGQTHRDMASDLFLSVRTIDSHLANARAKLGAESVQEALRIAAERGLVRRPDVADTTAGA